MRQPYNSDLFTDIHAKDFAVVVINARISSCVQNTFVRDRISVGRRVQKIIHLKLLPVHFNDVAFAVSGLRLLMEHLNWPFDNLILLLLIRVHQSIDMTKLMRKIVQIDPKQTPNQNEDWPDVIPSTAFASAIAD